MIGLNLLLVAALPAGIAITTSFFITNLIVDKRKLAGMPREQVSQAVPIWRSFLALLGPAAIAFSIHALLFVNGKVR